MKLTVIGVTLTLLMIASPPASAEGSSAVGEAPQTKISAPSQEHDPRPEPSFVPSSFGVPLQVDGLGFKLVPLGPDLVKRDYDAYMSSIEHLQTTFSRSTQWPHQSISDADAMRDMENEQGRFRNRKSFAYGVLTPDGSRELGSVYVSPSPVEGYDAMVRMWVTKADHDAGFDAKLYAWVAAWIGKDWPFVKVAYPGRSIDWATWDALVAATKARKAATQDQTP